MFEMNVPYDKGEMKISLSEKILQVFWKENSLSTPPNFLRKNW